jgi:two-component system, chemotaxis family, response regulator PixG
LIASATARKIANLCSIESHQVLFNIMNFNSQTNFKFKDLIAKFNTIKTDALSGNLIIQITDIPSWMLYFSAGRLAGISGGIDAIDRWKRNLALASLNVPIDRLTKSTNQQEVFANSNKLAQECAAQEVLFDIIQFSQNQDDRLLYRFIPVNDKNTQLQSVLPLLEIQPLLSATIQSWQQWEKHRLATYAPSFFPTIGNSAQTSNFDDNKNLQYLIASIDGNKSLRSLAIHHQRKLIDVAESLLPLIELGIIYLAPFKQSSSDQTNPIDPNLVSIVDLDATVRKVPPSVKMPSQQVIAPQRITTKQSPLIACIDDSFTVYKNLEKIITEYGYRSFGVQDPLKIMTSLIKNKPDLIFLDLVMPITNGYEVCEQIRKTPGLANIPIIILTGNDGLIDRVRTKFVGANGFLGKPIDPTAVLKMIDKYINKKQSTRVFSDFNQSGQVSIDAGHIVPQRRLEVLNTIGKRVLVVDDDRNIREVVSMCLHKLKGWNVLTAASGQEGLNGVELNNPDVIILDVMMPEMDGLAFLRQLRSSPQTKAIPVILLTANRYLPDKGLLTELGVVETISKPFLPVNLVRQIDKALLN